MKPKKIPYLKVGKWIFPIFLTFQSLFSQGSIKYDVKVIDIKGQPKVNQSITFVETNTFQTEKFFTNQTGLAEIKLEGGKEWTMHVGEMKNYNVLKVPARGEATGRATVLYDVEEWKRKTAPPVDRSKLNLVEIPQQIKASRAAEKDHSYVSIKIVSVDKKPWKDIPVHLTCFKQEKSYKTKTDASGTAHFMVPLNSEYQIDVDGEENFEYLAIDNFTSNQMELVYEKINFTEKPNKEGYIEQTFLETPKATSTRVYTELNIAGGPKNGKNEDVYLKMTYSNRIYHGKTDKEGKVIFLLPKKQKYIVSFPYQSDVDVVDLSHFRGIGNHSQHLNYQPDPRKQFPERYLPTKGLVKDYNINQFLTKIYPEPQGNKLVDVHIRWGNNKINSTSKEAILELGFSAKAPPKENKYDGPVNLTFVLDKSGSMAGEPFDLLKEAISQFIDKLRPTDYISIIFFDHEAKIAVNKQLVKDKELLKTIIASVDANGGTSIYNGLEKGFKELEKYLDPKIINRLILLTDGYGSRPIDDVLNLTQQYVDKGIPISTVGVGIDYNSALLNLIAEKSSGLKHYVLDSKNMTSVFASEMESIFFPCASDLKIEVTYNDKIVYKKLLGVNESYNIKGKFGFEIPQVYSSLNKMVLVKFKLENPDKGIEQDKINIKISYLDKTTNESVYINKETSLEWTDETDIELVIEEETKKLYSISVINQALKSIVDLCESKDYEKAKQNIKETMDYVNQLNKNTISTELQPLLKELQEYIISLNYAIKNINKY